MNVIILDDYQHVAHQKADWSLLKASVDFVHHPITSDDAFFKCLRKADIVVAMRERTAFTAKRLEGLPNLKLLVTTGKANAAIDRKAASQLGITLCGTESPSTATPELTWGLILSLLRHIPTEDHGMRQGAWQSTIGGDLFGHRLGIVGLGRLGERVAHIGQAFGMDVVAWSQNIAERESVPEGISIVSKETLFRTSDIISLHYKLSDRSRGLVSAQELEWMKSTALLVNTSRGALIDTDALITALSEKQIGGAGLDVYDIEPLPSDHPLRNLPNTVLSPHLGYVTEDTYTIFYQQALEDIMAWIEGKPIRVING